VLALRMWARLVAFAANRRMSVHLVCCCAQYHKTYLTQDEYNSRLSVFRANLEVAETLNAAGSATHGVTKFMDLTPAEFKSMYTGYKAGSVRAALGNAPVAKVCN
jgi:cathepsin F